MSKSFKVNLQYLYSEGNIDSYVNNVIKYKLGGFKSDEHGVEHKFLLNNKFGTENNPYYILYSGAVDSAGKLPLDFFFDKSKQPAPDPKKRDDRKDVFDELMPVMLSEGICKAKILFPYNIINIHWLTGEVVIDKKGGNVTIEIYTHNPYGGGKLSQENFAVLNTALHKRIEESGLRVISITTPPSPFTNARQTIADDTSCGIIVADELVKRITDSNLNISSPYPQGAEQLRLSQLTFLQEQLGEENLDYQLFKQQITLGGTHLEENLSINYVEYVPTLTIGEVREKVEQVVSSEESNIIKIVQLKKIEEEHYKPLIHQLAYKKKLEELKDLTIVLKDIGYLTAKLGELSGKLKYYTEAAIFYQYVITILDEKLNEGLISTYEQLAHIQQLIFSAIGGSQSQISIPNVKVESDNNRNILSTIRKETTNRLQEIEDCRQQVTNTQEEKQKNQESYVKQSKELFESIANKMQGFLAKLYSDSEKEMAISPPCKYAVIGLGSMALKQMTPYSDLEFAILIANEGNNESEGKEIKQYFKKLSHLVNFKVINLGESIIPTSRYGLDMSHLVHRAVNLDLGGKTPLGRIENDKPYELIKTVDWMMHYVRNEKDGASHIDKNLPYILENVCYVHGDKELVETYKGKVTKFLHDRNNDDSHSRLNCEIRAIKLLEEGTVEITYLQKVYNLKPKEIPFNGDIDKLKPNLFDAKGKLLDVKQEIYRLPDRMVYNLALYYGIEGDSAWDTVDKLEEQGIITLKAATNLKNAITFATILRLKTYSHYKAQNDDMSIFVRPVETESELKERAKQIFHLSEKDLGEQGGLFQYFYTALPLHRRLEKFCDQYQKLSKESRQTFFKESNFYKDNIANKGFIHYRLAQYTEAESNLELVVKDPNNQYNVKIRNVLGNIYETFGNADKAIKQFQESLDILKLIYRKEPNINVAGALLSLGDAYAAKGQYDQATKYYKQSLKMNKLIYQDRPHPYIASSLNNLGSVYQAKGQYDQATKYHEESLKMNKLIYQDRPHPDIASSLNNLGSVYQAKGQYDRATKYCEESLKMNKLTYKDEPYPNVVNSLNNLGVVCAAKGQYDQAIKYYEESLKMNKLIYQDRPHPDIASSLNNLGSVYQVKGQYDQATKYYEESLQMNKLIYKDALHSARANVLNNLGAAYAAKGQYGQAIKYYEESFKMRKLIYQDQPHPVVADSLNNLGNIYADTGQYDQATKYYEESLKMRKLIYQDQLHPVVADSLNNLGRVYRTKGQYDQATKYYEESFKIRRLIYKDAHPDIAASLNSLGTACDAKGQYDQAIKYYEESLKMRKLIYQNQPHPDVADSLNNLGNIYVGKEQYEQAINYLEESLKINKLIYKDAPHPNVVNSLNNLGGVYKATGQHEQAINYLEESLKMRKLIYKDVPHPNVVKSLYNLGLAYTAKGEYKLALDYSSQALKIISVFPNHPDQNTIQSFMVQIAMLFAKQYSLNSQEIVNKILFFTQQGLDFTDYQLHYAIALSQDDHDTNIQNIEKIIEESKLALIFFPEEQSEEQLQIKQTICDRLAELTREDQKNIELWLAVTENNVTEVQKLADSRIDLNHASFINTTPLIQAVKTGNIAMVSALLSGNIDINKPNNDQEQASPLYCSLGYLGQLVNMVIVKLLLDNYAKVNQPMYDGDTPMHMAYYKGNKEAIGLLLQYKANINAQTAEGKTPLHCLLESKNVSTETKLEIIQEFRQLYDITIKDKDDKTVTDYTKEHCPELLALLAINVKVVDPIDLSTTNHEINPNTSTNDNIDTDVHLLGGDSSTTN
jgi:tetratricopeptide (TPR) repeat protein